MKEKCHVPTPHWWVSILGTDLPEHWPYKNLFSSKHTLIQDKNLCQIQLHKSNEIRRKKKEGKGKFQKYI